MFRSELLTRSALLNVSVAFRDFRNTYDIYATNCILPVSMIFDVDAILGLCSCFISLRQMSSSFRHYHSIFSSHSPTLSLEVKMLSWMSTDQTEFCLSKQLPRNFLLYMCSYYHLPIKALRCKSNLPIESWFFPRHKCGVLGKECQLLIVFTSDSFYPCSSIFCLIRIVVKFFAISRFLAVLYSVMATFPFIVGSVMEIELFFKLYALPTAACAQDKLKNQLAFLTIHGSQIYLAENYPDFHLAVNVISHL